MPILQMVQQQLRIYVRLDRDRRLKKINITLVSAWLQKIHLSAPLKLTDRISSLLNLHKNKGVKIKKVLQVLVGRASLVSPH